MDKREYIIGAVGIMLAAILLTYGNIIMEFVFNALGI